VCWSGSCCSSDGIGPACRGCRWPPPAAMHGVATNILGLGLARDVLLGIAFALWTAWWIWLLVAFLRAPHPRHSRSQP
jgi:hypothetical protein